MCTMKGSQCLGNTYMPCDSPAILKEFLERVYGNRKVASTKMNDGSSRSHCVITLTLLTHDTAARPFKQTNFSIVDLAGAERPEKALGTRITKDKAVLELCMYMRDPINNDLSREAQGYLINFELTGLLSTVVAASDLAKAGKQYKPPNFGGSALNQNSRPENRGRQQYSIGVSPSSGSSWPGLGEEFHAGDQHFLGAAPISLLHLLFNILCDLRFDVLVNRLTAVYVTRCPIFVSSV